MMQLFLVPEPKPCFLKRAIYLGSDETLGIHPPPLHPSWCLSQGLAAISGLLPVAVNPVPWHMAADLDKEAGCSFLSAHQRPALSICSSCLL